VLDRQRIRREQNAVRVEDVIPAEILEGVPDADRDYLEQVFRDPQNFLPPRRPKTVKEPLPEEIEEPESRFSRRAKLAGLVAAGALVAGAVIAAPMLTTGHRTAPAGGDAPAGFSGAADLGGAAMPQGQSSGGAPDRQELSGQGAHSETAAPETSASEPATTTEAAPPGSHGLSAKSAAAKLDAVKKFYATIARSSQDALALLTPVLADSGPGELVRTWSSMDAIDVQEADTSVQPDGSVLAVATLHRPDGALVRVKQLFRVADDTSGLITAAELISAQYM
jgi:hypothetical protein